MKGNVGTGSGQETGMGILAAAERGGFSFEALADEYDHMGEQTPPQTSMEQWTEVDADGDLPF